MSATTPVFVAPGAAAPEDLDQVEASVASSRPEAALKGQVLQRLKANTARLPIVLDVPDRTGFQVRYSVMLDIDQVKSWQRASIVDGEMDLFRLALLTMVGQCEAILVDGEPVKDQGETVTFQSPAFLDLYGAITADVAARAFYGNDTMVNATYQAILTASGAGDRLDPTTVSSA